MVFCLLLITYGALAHSNELNYYFDVADTTSIEQLQNSEFLFKSNSKKNVHFGFSNHPIWIKATFTPMKAGHRMVATIPVPALHYITFYYKDSSGIMHSDSSGLLVPKIGPFLPSFIIPENHDSSITIYAKIKSETPLLVPLKIMELSKFYIYDRMVQNGLGLYFGAMIMMILYHLYLAFAFRNKAYLYFALFILFFAAGQISAVYGYIIKNYYPKLLLDGYPYLHMVNYLAVATVLLFTRRMLQISTHSLFLDRVFYAITVGSIILGTVSPLFQFQTRELILVLVNLISAPLILFTGIVTMRMGYRPALYFVYSTLISIVSLLIYNLMYGYGIFPFSTWLYFLPNLSFICTMILFASSLADRFYTIRRQHEHASAVAMKNMKKVIEVTGEKKTVEEQLFQLQKMEALGQLVGGIVHDLRNMLTTFFGYAVLIKKISDDPKIQNYSDRIVVTANQASELTSRLLDFSRKESRALAPMNIVNCVEGVVDMLNHTIPKMIQIKYKSTIENKEIIGDNSLLQNAVLNLGINARDAMPNGGIISLHLFEILLTDLSDRENPFGANPGEYVCIEVADNGTGIDQKTLTRIFEPFFTTKAKGKGTGLGLSGVYGCVRSHHGLIDVSSTVGQGTTFSLYFPRQIQMVVSSDTTILMPLIRPAEVKTIIIVDDDPGVLALLKESIAELSYEVITFESGQQAVKWFVENNAQKILLIVDLLMPSMSGRECIIKMKSISNDIPVIVMTAFAEDSEYYAVQKLGICGILSKPFDIEAVNRSVIEATNVNARAK